ncbi:MAG TPA: HD domain-containing phosphohydrolase [Thermoanaerobaculia bacterium]|nr:HD domain-containing phosphohydrolase [Thermoanaerobaculia bacterium]
MSERAPIQQLIVEISATINARTLYGASHPTVAGAIERVARTLEGILGTERRDSLTFLIVGNDLLADQQPLRQDTLFQRQFIQSLKRRGVERLTLASGLTPAELAAFVDSMAEGTSPVSSDHLVVGRVEVAFMDDEDAAARRGEGAAGLSVEQIEKAKEAFTRFRRDRTVAIGLIEEVVGGLAESLARSTRSMLPLARLKDHDEYTFIHSVNVSTLVMASARWHGFSSDQIRSMGVAAMLHDIGKLAVPLEILNKPGKLEGEEWTRMAGHAELGAWSLAASPATPPLAIAVAYEHHLRYDGEPNYPSLLDGRRPSLVSRMTSIADTYDAICTIRPYQAAKSKAAALEIIRKRAGSFYDPFLVANFELMVRAESRAEG